MKTSSLKTIVRSFFTLSSILLFFFQSLSASILDGIYSIPDGVYLQLKHDGYESWFEEEENKITLQSGTYKINGRTILFHPTYDIVHQVPGIFSGEEDEKADLATARIIDACTVEWGGDRFRKKECPAAAKSAKYDDHASQIEDIGKKKDLAPTTHETKKSAWKLIKKGGVELSVPPGAEVYADKEGIEITYQKAIAGIEYIDDNRDFSEKMIEDCQPRKSFRKGNLTIYQCSKRSDHRYLMLLERMIKNYKFVYYIAADTPEMLKKLSISLASLDVRPKTAKMASHTLLPVFHLWYPTDRSFSIKVPQGWSAAGRTADLGRNGYLRIVHVFSPDRKKGLIGIYSPFYQYIQMGSSPVGYPPMDAKSYVHRVLFSFLTQYGINFYNLKILNVDIDPEASQEASMEAANLARQYNFSGNINYQVVWGKGFFGTPTQSEELLLFGYMQYIQMYQVYAAMTYMWGPAPLYLVYAPKEEMPQWFKILEKIGESWQVNSQWLSSHLNYARQDAQKSIEHFKKISKIIHQHEESLNEAMNASDAQNHFEEELHWDRFYALGGEERLNDPDTGEEIDLPTGADKYLYDRYSQSWVGIHQDQPDAEAWSRALKENGWIELKPHKW